MTENYVTGVVGNNGPEWLNDDIYKGIDLAYREHIATCDDCKHGQCDHWDSLPSSTMLIGFHETRDIRISYFGLSDGTLYAADPRAEYSAIVGEIYTQVVRSEWVQDCQRCSPCYPGQGDLDTPGSFYTAYTLPPDVWGDSAPDGIRKVQS